MAKAGRKRKQGKRRSDPTVNQFLRPTEAREAHNDFESAGAAWRVKVPIAQLRKSEFITQEEFDALAYYRDQACLADKSPMRSCIDFSPKGGHGPGVAIMSARDEVRRIEQGLGGYLTRLLQFVVRDDNPIQAWVREYYGDVPIKEKLGETILELKYAAGGIVR